MGKSCINGHGRNWSEYIARLFSKESMERLKVCARRGDLGVLSVQIQDFYSAVGVFGENVGFRLLEELEREASDKFAQFFKGCEVISTEKNKLDDYMIFFNLPDRAVTRLADGAYPYRVNVREGFNNKVFDIIGKPLDLRVGYGWICKDRSDSFDQHLFKAICDAQRNAATRSVTEHVRLYHEFLKILEQDLLENEYQPVLNLSSGQLLGWESLARGPVGSPFREPGMLFSFAEEAGKVLTLDRLCRERAIRKAGAVAVDQKLFINIHLCSLHDVNFDPQQTARFIKTADLQLSNIVLEISEKQVVRDLDVLLESLETWRMEGVLIAIDDIGAGQASLRLISQIRPDFIKIDLSLIRGIDCNPIKRVMVETFMVLAEKVGCRVVAEGIETEKELSSLVSLGVHFGQGFHIARPAFPKPSISGRIPARLSMSDAIAGDLKCSLPAANLVQKSLQVPPQQTVQQVKAALVNRPPMSSVVVVEGSKPVGLIMNYNLDRQLGTLFGVSLFYRREVSRLMDRSPLIMEADIPLEQVARAAMDRDSEKVYDDIIITANGLLLGTISVQTMLDTLAKVQVEMAKGANPLTGLPGNVAIEQEINRRAKNKIPCSLIYIDLDNFKVYNDAYGFENGDRIILFTAKVIDQAAQSDGVAGDFVGHIGGDDFVIISEQDYAEKIASTIVHRFETEVSQLYNPEDRKRGHIVGKGRDGSDCRVPLISVSIGIVDCAFESFFSMDELSHRVAEIKKYAKTIAGNAYVRDRRAPIGALSDLDRDGNDQSPHSLQGS